MNEKLVTIDVDAERHTLLSKLLGERLTQNRRLIAHIKEQGITKRYCMGRPFAEDGKILVAQAEREIDLCMELIHELK